MHISAWGLPDGQNPLQKSCYICADCHGLVLAPGQKKAQYAQNFLICKCLTNLQGERMKGQDMAVNGFNKTGRKGHGERCSSMDNGTISTLQPDHEEPNPHNAQAYLKDIKMRVLNNSQHRSKKSSMHASGATSQLSSTNGFAANRKMKASTGLLNLNG